MHMRVNPKHLYLYVEHKYVMRQFLEFSRNDFSEQTYDFNAIPCNWNNDKNIISINISVQNNKEIQKICPSYSRNKKSCVVFAKESQELIYHIVSR